MQQALRTFSQRIRSPLQRLIDCLDGLGEQELNWRPPAREANSLYLLATHVMGNVEENVLGVACGRPFERDRDAEFAASGPSAEPLVGRARELVGQVEEALASLDAADLFAERHHPRRGTVLAFEALLIAAQHAAEHVGQMELTRDLSRAKRPA